MATGLGGEQLWLSPTVANNVNPYDDQSGQGNNGTNNGTTVVSDTSSGGTYAFEFDQINDYINCGQGNFPTDLSVSVWLNVLSFSNGNKGIVNTFASGGTSDEYGINTSSANQIVSAIYGDTVHDTAALSANTWHHLTITRDTTSGFVSFYRDGVLVSQRAIAGTVPSTPPAKDFIMGRYGGGNYYGGRMDDIRQYNRALTQSEITHLASQRGIEGPPPVGLGDEQLWLCPSLNDSANDISGNGNDGTYQGGMGTVADTSNGGSLAYQFDGTDDYIDCGSSASLDKTSDDPVSQSGWVKVVNTNTVQFILTPKSLSGSGFTGTHLTIQGGALVLQFIKTFGTNELSVSTGSVLTTGWHHIAFSYDGSRSPSGAKVYINGVSQTLSTNTNNLLAGEAVTNVGGSMLVSTRSSLGSTPVNGTLQDDLRLFNRTLTQAEITHLATSRGVLGPPGGATHYNPFKTHAFTNNFQQRLR